MPPSNPCFRCSQLNLRCSVMSQCGPKYPPDVIEHVDHKFLIDPKEIEGRPDNKHGENSKSSLADFSNGDSHPMPRILVPDSDELFNPMED